MKGSRSKPKPKKVSITLPEWEGEMLKAYARAHRTTCPAAVHKMVRQALREYKSELSALPKAEPKNQLNLFDSIQVDIFNNTAKVVGEERELSQPNKRCGKDTARKQVNKKT